MAPVVVCLVFFTIPLYYVVGNEPIPSVQGVPQRQTCIELYEVSSDQLDKPIATGVGTQGQTEANVSTRRQAPYAS